MRLNNSEALNKTNCLTNVKQIIDEYGEIEYKGNFQNLLCKINQYGITLYGSLPKYFYGDNLQVLTRSDTQKAIQKLSDEIGLPLNESNIYRIDIGNNFAMKEPINAYLCCLGDSSRLEKKPYKHGLQYSNKSKTLSFYDKISDMKRHKESVPELFRTQNILRYEIHLTKGIKKQFGLKELKASKLYQENLYIRLLDKWKNEYFSIERINKPRFTSEVFEMIEVKFLINELALVGLKQIGEDTIMELIEDSYKSGKIEYMQAHRLKDKIKQLRNLPELTEPSETIQELDSKVNEAVQFL